MPGSAGGGWLGVFGGGAWVSVRSFEEGSGEGADGQSGHDQHGMTGDRGVEPGLALIEAELVLAELEILLYRPPQPGSTDQSGHGYRLSFGHVAVVKGQLTGAQVTAHQQVVPRRGGGDPRPCVPAMPLVTRAGRSGLPPPLVLDEQGDGLRAAAPGFAGSTRA
jgi:hypothetical protein